MYYIVFALAITLFPLTGNAAGSLQGLISGVGVFLDEVIIPVILGIAFLSLVWNVVRFFIIGADNEESQQNAKNLAFYSIAAFVFILSFWGIIRVVENGIGLNDTECLQSDYYEVFRSAPCSSPRPQSRPQSSNNTTPAADQTATGVPADNSTPSDATSFDINGNPITTTTLGEAEKLARDTQAALITTAAETSYVDDFETLYGVNKDVVRDALFPGLIVADNSVSDLNRLRGAYRLSAAGTITPDQLTSYTTAVQAYNTASGRPELNQTLTLNTISNISQPLPASVTANIAASKSAFTTAIAQYNAQAAAGKTVPANTLNSLFDTTLSPTTRASNLDALIHSSASDVVTPALRDTFLQNINTENAFAGQLANPQI